jgi:UDP:flavonoid glycosyltransferase YjiC (YdhE family)
VTKQTGATVAGIRILFLPPFFGYPSHFIPLVKLYQQLSRHHQEVAFLLPQLSPRDITALGEKGFNLSAGYYYSNEFLSSFDLPVLEIKQQFSVFSELAAYTKFQPTLIVDDTNLTTYIARQVRHIPRITIVRSGVFNDDKPQRYRHSLEPLISKFLFQGSIPFKKPPQLEDFFQAEAFVVPGSNLIENVHIPHHASERTFSAGPLILNEREELQFHSNELESFVNANRDRKIVYVTFGVDPTTSASPALLECVKGLIRREYSIVTNFRPIASVNLLPDCPVPQNRYFYSTAIPMHYVCERADLVIHVCGSATYHYPIMHGKPAITIGTQTRDRENVAQHLCAHGLSHHVPAPTENTDFISQFESAIQLYETGAYPFDHLLPYRLAKLREELKDTAARFSFDRVIESALETSSQG